MGPRGGVWIGPLCSVALRSSYFARLKVCIRTLPYVFVTMVKCMHGKRGPPKKASGGIKKRRICGCCRFRQRWRLKQKQKEERKKKAEALAKKRKCFGNMPQRLWSSSTAEQAHWRTAHPFLCKKCRTPHRFASQLVLDTHNFKLHDGPPANETGICVGDGVEIVSGKYANIDGVTVKSISKNTCRLLLPDGSLTGNIHYYYIRPKLELIDV